MLSVIILSIIKQCHYVEICLCWAWCFSLLCWVSLSRVSLCWVPLTSVIMLIVVYAECVVFHCYAGCHHALCHYASFIYAEYNVWIVMLSLFILVAIMPSVIVPSVIYAVSCLYWHAECHCAAYHLSWVSNLLFLRKVSLYRMSLCWTSWRHLLSESADNHQRSDLF